MDVKLRIRTRERRYLLEDVSALERLLLEHGAPVEYVPGRPETLITTVYFDTAEGTWSQGRSQTKIRARNYQDPGQWWFELKRREGTRVDKWRRPMSINKVMGTLSGQDRWKTVSRVATTSPLVPVFGVQCRRTAYEWVGLRATIDRDLCFFRVDAEAPLQLAQRQASLAGVVVEVKCEGEIPSWLNDALEGREARGFSKSRYAMALRDGGARPCLIVEDGGGLAERTVSAESGEHRQQVA